MKKKSVVASWRGFRLKEAGPMKIKLFAAIQKNWAALVPVLGRGKYTDLDTAFLSIAGEAPKSFIHIKEFRPDRRCRHPTDWPSHIAKVGAKHYPVESFTEHLITSVGNILGLKMAETRLVIVAGQVRLLSRFFLRRDRQQLEHGTDILMNQLGKDFVEEVAKKKAEQGVYTFQAIQDAIRDLYPREHEEIVDRLVVMLGFDAIIGNNDRHPANWGVITSIASTKSEHRPAFSPIYDTARGLFWNIEERKLRNFDENRLTAYMNGSRPQVGWDDYNPKVRLDHFRLIELIARSSTRHAACLGGLVAEGFEARIAKMVASDFAQLLSPLRARLINRCLQLRFRQFCAAIGDG